MNKFAILSNLLFLWEKNQPKIMLKKIDFGSFNFNLTWAQSIFVWFANQFSQINRILMQTGSC